MRKRIPRFKSYHFSKVERKMFSCLQKRSQTSRPRVNTLTIYKHLNPQEDYYIIVSWGLLLVFRCLTRPKSEPYPFWYRVAAFAAPRCRRGWLGAASSTWCCWSSGRLGRGLLCRSGSYVAAAAGPQERRFNALDSLRWTSRGRSDVTWE